jgi:PAS domain S-box-containing protein
MNGADDEALRARNHLLESVLRSTGQGFWYIGVDGLSLDVNPAMCRLLGRPREQIVGRSVFDFFAGADLERLRAEIEARRHGRTAAYEIDITRPDGSRRRCLNNATPVDDAQGVQIGSVGLWTDVTMLREAEDALRTAAFALDSIADMVSVIDAESRYLMVNDAWCRNLGVARADAIGRRNTEIGPNVATPARQRAIDDCLRTGEPRTLRGLAELRGLGAHAQRRYETTYFPYAGDAAGRHRVVQVPHDVTEQEAPRARSCATRRATGPASPRCCKAGAPANGRSSSPTAACCWPASSPQRSATARCGSGAFAT